MDKMQLSIIFLAAAVCAGPGLSVVDAKEVLHPVLSIRFSTIMY